MESRTSDSIVVLDQPPADDRPFIVTHNGYFQCDEALAIAMLQLLPEYRDLPIVRTRDTSIIERAKFAIDVGGEYEPDRLRFDHHQRDFNETFTSDQFIKLSSAGLIYRHFGKEIIKQVCGEKWELDEEALRIVYQKCYNAFIKHIDGFDNGIESHTGIANYHVTTSLPARVNMWNHAWTDTENFTTTGQNEAFKGVVVLTGTEFVAHLTNIVAVWLPALKVVEEAVLWRHHIHPSGSIICLKKSCPFREHLHELEKKQGCHILYVVYEDVDTKWRAIATNIPNSRFRSRKPFPPAIRGLRDEELRKKSGVPDAMFVHMNGFIAGAESYEGALKLALLGMEG